MGMQKVRGAVVNQFNSGVGREGTYIRPRQDDYRSTF